MLFFSSPSINKNIRLIASNIIWVCIVWYFAYHVTSGARGVLSWNKLQVEVVNLERELKILKEENAFLENKISLLRNDNIDLDLLEEVARSVLGLSYENDLIVMLPRGE
jgi:cell division protein FtsB